MMPALITAAAVLLAFQDRRRANAGDQINRSTRHSNVLHGLGRKRLHQGFRVVSQKWLCTTWCSC